MARTIREIILAPGFSRAFSQMIKYARENEGAEASLRGYEGRTRAYFDVQCGESWESTPSHAKSCAGIYDAEGALIRKSTFSAYALFCTVSENPQNLRLEMRANTNYPSGFDFYFLESFRKKAKPGAAIGAAEPGESESACLIWKPSQEFFDSEAKMRESYHRQFLTDDAETAANVLSQYGTAKMVGFELKDKIWQPSAESLGKLDEFG